jgi:WD40 repeat protein
VRIWDLASGTLIHQLPGHRSGVSALAVTALADQPVAVTGGGLGDGAVRIWDLASGTLIHQLPNNTIAVTTIAVNVLNSQTIAITGGIYDTTAEVWDLSSRTLIRELSGHASGVTAITVTDVGGDTIAVTADDDTVRAWDPLEGHQLRTISVGAEVTAIEFGPPNVLLVGSPMGLMAFRLHWSQSDTLELKRHPRTTG